MWFDLLILGTSIVAAAIAAVTGFGVGSLLTPAVGLAVETKVAVAAVSIPHLVATVIRFWQLRTSIDRGVLWRFGVPSAVGGLAGALLHGQASSPWLSILFGALLLFAAGSELIGLVQRLHVRGTAAWVAGVVSGLLGGMVGNQGGIRSAALLGFELSRRSFVATATAVGLIVDGARMPVYLVTAGGELRQLVVPIAVATAGVIVGTVFGTRVLARIPETRFRRVVAIILAALGLAMTVQGMRRI